MPPKVNVQRQAGGSLTSREEHLPASGGGNITIIFSEVFAMIRISPGEITGSVFDRVGKQWMLITTEGAGRVNAMTASWGGFGVLWNRPVAFAFVRPQRYTFELIESSELFTLSFLPEALCAAHQICGSKSGRDLDKLAASGLTAKRLEGAPAIEQAELVVCCKKIYSQFLTGESFAGAEIPAQVYPSGDFHKMYVGEIIAAEMAENKG